MCDREQITGTYDLYLIAGAVGATGSTGVQGASGLLRIGLLKLI